MMNTSGKQLLTELTRLSDRLEAMMEEKAVMGTLYYIMSLRWITEMAKIVADALIGNREKIKEGVDRIMDGKVLEHRAKQIKHEQKNEDTRAMYDDGLEPKRIARILKLELADVEIMLGLRKMA